MGLVVSLLLLVAAQLILRRGPKEGAAMLLDGGWRF